MAATECHGLTAGKKRSAQEGSSVYWPIIIDDSDSPKWTDIDQRPRIKRQRTTKRERNAIAVQNPPTPTDSLHKLLQSSQNIIVISGAGISASAGYNTFKEIRKSKKISFHSSFYYSLVETASFYSIVCTMFEHLHSNTPTLFYRFMDKLARSRPYFQYYTQNIDCLETLFPDLDNKTIRLHGQVNQARCQVCRYICQFEPDLFQGSDSPGCPRCLERSQERIKRGRRALCLGRLRPDIVLYDEPHPDDELIVETVKESASIRPDLVLIVGTTLKVPGAYLIAKQLCQAAQRAGGANFWISKEQPAASIRSLFDHIIIGDSDTVILSAMLKS